MFQPLAPTPPLLGSAALVASTAPAIILLAAAVTLVGIALVVVGMRLVKATRADHVALGPLEVIGDRSWRNADADRRSHALAEARPIGAEPVGAGAGYGGDDAVTTDAGAGAAGASTAAEPVVDGERPAVGDPRSAAGDAGTAGENAGVDNSVPASAGERGIVWTEQPEEHEMITATESASASVAESADADLSEAARTTPTPPSNVPTTGRPGVEGALASDPGGLPPIPQPGPLTPEPAPPLPGPEPAPTPLPGPDPAPMPDPTPAPTPEPMPAPVPGPDYPPTPDPGTPPIPDPAPEPTPDPAPGPIPAVGDARPGGEAAPDLADPDSEWSDPNATRSALTDANGGEIGDGAAGRDSD